MSGLLVPNIVSPPVLSETDEDVRNRLLAQLRPAQFANWRQEQFYEGSRRVRDLGIAIPPNLTDVEAVAAWPEIVTDVIDERMDWRGWYTPAADLGLDVVYRENHLDVESGQSTLDSLICGLSYMSVGTGDVEEPDVLVKAESPSAVTGTWDSRRRRLTEAIRELRDPRGNITGWVLYQLNKTTTVERQRGRLIVTNVDEHVMNRIPMAVFLNRPRSSRVSGRSEITRAVRSLTESGMRTLLGMEVAREFYGAPQRYLMGADEGMFVDENGNKKSQWDAIIGKMLMAPRDEDGQLPVPGAFASASPQPFSDLLRTYSQMISAATGVPATHLGFTTDNPASADAIQRADMRLDSRAIRRQGQYNMGYVELGNLVCLWRDGELPEPGAIQSIWVDPSTPTPAASADRAVKLAGAGIIPPDSDVLLEDLGYDDDQIIRIKRDRRRAEGAATRKAIAIAAATPPPVPGQPLVTPPASGPTG